MVCTAAPVLAIAILESESETKKDRAFKGSFNARHNSGSLMPAIPYNFHLQEGGGHDFEISASTHLLAQPWQGISRKQAKMTQAYSSKSQHR